MGKVSNKPVTVDLSEEQSAAKISAAKKTAKKTEKKALHSQKYQEAAAQVEKNHFYSVKEAIELAQKTSYSKFTGTIELHINTNVKNIRGLITLPYISGKSLTILAFGKGAAEAGADLVGSDETITEIEKGKINFDVVVTTPEWMPKLARIARILGPKGLMPNPKSGTITENLSRTVTDLKGGKTEYRTEAGGQVIHLGVGKADQSVEEIAANIKTLYIVVGKSKVKKATLVPTMGPGVKINLSSI